MPLPGIGNNLLNSSFGGPVQSPVRLPGIGYQLWRIACPATYYFEGNLEAGYLLGDFNDLSHGSSTAASEVDRHGLPVL
jgi:hypothetical protein